MAARTVIHGDGLAWLRETVLEPGQAIVTSLPDVSELPALDLAQWSAWSCSAAALVCASVSPQSLAVFYQTHIKRDGRWIDKSQLVHRGADASGASCLWHKIVCRKPPGHTTFGRPAFGHLLCFSRALRLPSSNATPDVLPDPGTMTWSRAMPLAACELVCRFVRSLAGCHTIVDPFCGRGTILAVANAHGLDAMGVEISRKRANKARMLVLPAAHRGSV